MKIGDTKERIIKKDGVQYKQILTVTSEETLGQEDAFTVLVREVMEDLYDPDENNIEVVAKRIAKLAERRGLLITDTERGY